MRKYGVFKNITNKIKNKNFIMLLLLLLGLLFISTFKTFGFANMNAELIVFDNNKHFNPVVISTSDNDMQFYTKLQLSFYENKKPNVVYLADKDSIETRPNLEKAITNKKEVDSKLLEGYKMDLKLSTDTISVYSKKVFIEGVSHLNVFAYDKQTLHIVQYDTTNNDIPINDISRYKYKFVSFDDFNSSDGTSINFKDETAYKELFDNKIKSKPANCYNFDSLEKDTWYIMGVTQSVENKYILNLFYSSSIGPANLSSTSFTPVDFEKRLETINNRNNKNYSFEYDINMEAIQGDESNFENIVDEFVYHLDFNGNRVDFFDKKYNITYNLDGGTLPSDAKTEFTSNEVVELPVPTRDGYGFGGWTEKVDYTLGDYWEKDADGNLLVSDNLSNDPSYRPELRAPEPGNAHAIERGLKFKMESAGKLSFEYHCEATNNGGIYGGKYGIYKNGALVEIKSMPEFSEWYSSGIITCNLNLTEGDYSIIFYGHSNSYGFGVTGTVKNLNISSLITSIPKGTNEDKILTAKWKIDEKFKIKEGTLPYGDIVTSVSFDKGIPNLTGKTYTDVSDSQDGSLIAYLNGTEMHVVSNGIVEFHPNSSNMFSNFSKITSINFNNNITTINVSNMDSMFFNCSNLISIDFSNLNTSNVITMNNMLARCRLLTDISGMLNWDISKVRGLNNMFSFNTSLQNISALKNWNTSSVIWMNNLFFNTSIIDLTPLSNWNVSNVNYFNSTFAMTKITKIDALKNWNVQYVSDFSSMFKNCYDLESVYINFWNMSNGKSFDYMFENCSKIKSLTALQYWTLPQNTYYSTIGIFDGIPNTTPRPPWYI